MSSFYRSVNPSFWTGNTGKKLRGDPESQLVALYLITNPHTHMSGVYHLPIAYLCTDIGISEKAAWKGLARLSEVSFCEYDKDTETVFVLNMLHFQFGNMKSSDNKYKSIVKWFAELPNSYIKQRFASIYGSQYGIEYEAPYKPLDSTLEAPKGSVAVTGTETVTRSATNVERPDCVSKDVWDEFSRICKSKDKPIGKYVFKKIVEESEKIGWDLEQTLIWCCEKGYARFEAEWVKDKTQVVDSFMTGAV